jgi:hypothetical protein
LPRETPFLYKLYLMRIKVSTLHILVVIFTGGLVSCGGSEAPQEGSASTEAPTAEAPAAASATCALLTSGEIQEALGKAPGAPQSPVGTEDCIWPAADDPSSNLVRLTTSDSGYESYDAFVASYAAEFGGEQPPTEYYRPIQGVGDWAMYVADENALQVFKGGRMLQVAVNPPSDAQALALAQKAVARLP